jgi:hypothetical protein
MKRLIVAAIVAASVAGVPADATVLTLDFSGVFTGSGGPVGLGSTFSGSVVYDTANLWTEEFTSGPARFTIYNVIQSATFSSGSLNLTFVPDGIVNYVYLGVYDGHTSGHDDSVQFNLNEPGTYNMDVDFSGSYLASNSVANPSTIEELEAYPNVSVNIRDSASSLSGSITSYSLTQSVPEPATWAMMLSGFGLVGACMRRRTQMSAFA